MKREMHSSHTSICHVTVILNSRTNKYLFRANYVIQVFLSFGTKIYDELKGRTVYLIYIVQIHDTKQL